MPRLIALSAGLLSLSVLAVDASAQSASPGQTSDASSDNDATALAKKLQNPIGDLYSFPFRNNTNFNTGPNKGRQDILNVQPVSAGMPTTSGCLFRCSQKLKAFLTTLPEFPFQPGSSLNAAGINYNSIQVMQAMKHLNELESLRPPTD
jgi:hypothetical protein